MDPENNLLPELKVEIGNVKSQLNQMFNHLANLLDEFDEHNNKLTEPGKLIKDHQSQAQLITNLKTNLKLACSAIHDITQPLTVLIGRCELLGKVDNLQPEIIKQIKPILSSAEKIGEMINKIRFINGGLIEQLESDFKSVCQKQSQYSEEEKT